METKEGLGSTVLHLDIFSSVALFDPDYQTMACLLLLLDP